MAAYASYVHSPWRGPGMWSARTTIGSVSVLAVIAVLPPSWYYLPINPSRCEDTCMTALPADPALTIRDARDDDSWDLIGLIAACWADYPGCILDVHGEEPWLLRPASAYQDQGGRLWVAELDG